MGYITMVAILRLFAMVALSAGQDDASTLLQMQRAVIQPQKEQSAPKLVETQEGLESEEEGEWFKKAWNAVKNRGRKHARKAKNSAKNRLNKEKAKAKNRLNKETAKAK